MSGFTVKRDSGLFIGDVDVAPASGTIQITENGEHNVAQYAMAEVDVAVGITVNESYDISEGTLTKGNVTLEGDVVANIPDGVTTISTEAFYNNFIITKVIMPNSVLTAEDGFADFGCFANNLNLKEVILSNNLSKISLNMFYYCPSLTSIIIPDGVTSIGDNAFIYCTGLTSIIIPDSVTSIGNSAFNGCTGLTSIIIPDGVTSIGRFAFGNCGDLTDIYYTGTQAEWEAIEGIANAGIPSGATIHYEYAGDGSEL